MTQEPGNPDDSKPSEPSTSAWAPRSADATPPASEPASAEPEAGSTESTSAAEAETPAAEAEPLSEAAETAAEAETTSQAAVAVQEEQPPAKARRSGVPPWVLALAAIVPAVIVGLAVYFAVHGNSGGSSSSEAASVVDGLMRLGRSDQSSIQSYAQELPPDFATDFPMYPKADVVVSIAIASDQGTGYLIVLSSPDPATDVFDYYSQALDKDPWQVEIGRSSDQFTGVRFSRPDNIDITGDISLYESSIDQRTVIYLSYNDASQSILPGGGTVTPDFTLGVSRPLPTGFPDEIPIYQGDEPSVVLDTYFERGQGGQAFIVTFLTKNSQDDVIQYYRDQFQGKGWNVTDSGVSSTSFALSIQFDDGNANNFSGSVTADTFASDSDFTQVDLLVTVNKSN